MKRSRFTEEQVIGILREHEAGADRLRSRHGADLERRPGLVGQLHDTDQRPADHPPVRWSEPVPAQWPNSDNSVSPALDRSRPEHPLCVWPNGLNWSGACYFMVPTRALPLQLRTGSRNASAWRAAVLVSVIGLLTTVPAEAHGVGRGFVLLLPTGYYLFGGAATVLITFVLLSFGRSTLLQRMARSRLHLGTMPAIRPEPTSATSLLLLSLLVAAGLYGSRDPLLNPLPLAIWTVWWVALTLLHAVAGNLWAYINPWIAPFRLFDLLAGGRFGRVPLIRYPSWLGYWPAIGFFFAFAWLELIYIAPDDPETLATIVAGYWIVAFAGMLLFGYDIWIDRAEPFSIFFRLVGGLSPLVITGAEGRRRQVAIAFPGAALLDRAQLPLSGVLFVLLTLSAVSFDGLSKSFWWLSLGGINPLEYPGRSAVTGRNTIGLVLTWATLGIAYTFALRVGFTMVGKTHLFRPALGGLVYSILPISIAFHLSHYLTALLVNIQYALIAVSDPLGNNLNLFGFRELRVTTSFLNTLDGVKTIWNVQTAAIVLGHVEAVALGHLLALRRIGHSSAAAMSQVPLALLMVAYTLFGLWVLSTPTFMP